MAPNTQSFLALLGHFTKFHIVSEYPTLHNFKHISCIYIAPHRVSTPLGHFTWVCNVNGHATLNNSEHLFGIFYGHPTFNDY